ncbi:MAG: hypothetical protein IH984_16680 [Planctomycetes bacterium]|nr:hypothetical protein [Planctomycetota bacterium]
MKTKGITIWEQHAEKFVLGISGLLFVGFTALQFIGEQEEMTAVKVDSYLIEAAELLQVQMESSATASLDIPEPVTAHSILESSLASSICPEVMVDFPQIRLAPQIAFTGNGKKEVRFAELNFAPPDRITVTQTTDTLADGVLDEVPELAAYLDDPNGPPDITWTTPFVQFDREALMQQVRGELLNEGDGIKSIPSSWYASPLTIVDVRFERETLVDDGIWTQLTLLEQIPSRFSLRDLLEKDIDNTARSQILSQARNVNLQEDISQPAFYATRNDSWAPVSFKEEIIKIGSEPEDPRIGALRRNLRRLLYKKADIVKKLEEAGGPLDENSPPGGIGNPPGGNPGGGGRGDGGRGRGRGGRGGSGDGDGGGKKAPPGGGIGGMGSGGSGLGRRDIGGADSERGRKKRIGLTKQLKKVQIKIDRIRKELPDEPDDVTPIGEGIDESAILVWTHDLTAKSGETYRYRATINVYNPFFGKRRNLSSDQEHLADLFIIASAASEWSSQITVDSRLQLYIIRASAPGQSGGSGSLGLGLATAEVFRYYDGREWMETFKVQPGEHIGGLEMQRHEGMEVDFSTGIYVLDIIGDINEERNGIQIRTGHAARVLLQDTAGEQSVEIRHPRSDSSDPNREDLRYRVQERKRIARNSDG